MQAVSDSAELFRHVSAEKAYFYRCIMDVFAAAKRQYRLQLRPDEVLAEARWPAKLPEIEEVNAALTQLIWSRILTLRGCPVSVISIVLAISIGSRKAVKP
jgi:DNA-directed RNA polymerase specialized sigma24 family protein